MKYNVNQVLSGIDEYQNLVELKSEIADLQNSMLICQVIAAVLGIVVVVEAVVMVARRKK